MRDYSRQPGRGYKALACGALLALYLPWGTAGAADKETANPYMGKVTQLREKFKYDDALGMLEQARKWPSNTKEQTVTLDLLEGVLRYEGPHQLERAEQAFQRALTASPDAQIPLEVSPKITQLLEEVRTRVKRDVPAPAPAAPLKDSEVTLAKNGGAQELTVQGPSATVRERLSPYRTHLAIAGGGVAAVGVFSWIQARATEHRLRAGDESITTRAQFDDAVRRGKTYETVGWVLLGTGAATTLGSLLLLRPSPAVPSLSAVPTQGGAYVSLGWRTP